MIDRLIVEQDLKGDVLDFGSGDGIYSQKVLDCGGTVMAIDIDESMIAHSRSKLGQFEHFSSFVGGVETIKNIPDKSIDTVLSLNVIAYLHNGQDLCFYKEASRILKKNGVLILTHSNELFDMFTFNKYTVDFFKENFSIKEECDIKDLLVNSKLPDRTPQTVRANPLSFGIQMESYHFKETKQEFSIPHKLPPLLLNEDPDDLPNRKMIDLENLNKEDSWKKMFMCSIFGSRLVKQ